MSCNALENTKKHLIKNNLMDGQYNFTGPSIMGIYNINNNLMKLAKEKYGISTGNLITLENKSYGAFGRPDSFGNSPTVNRMKVVFNEQAFQDIENIKTNTLLSPSTEPIDNPIEDNTFEDNTFEGANLKNLINYKEQMIAMLESKKAQVSAKLTNKKLDSEERSKLLKVRREITDRLEGTKDKIGLHSELVQLKDKDVATVNITQSLDNDLVRLDGLSKSNNPSDLREAQSLINFFDLLGTFSPTLEHPMFTKDQIFNKDSSGNFTPNIILPSNLVDLLVSYKDKANGYQAGLDLKNREALETMANQITGQNISYEELTKPFKDVDWASMFLMDISQGILNPASVFAQIIHAQAQDVMDEAAAIGKRTAERLEAIQPDVERELATLDGGKYKLNSLGILGVKGVSYKIFMQKYKSGRETGKLINQFTEEYFDLSNEMYRQFNNDKNKAGAETSSDAKVILYKNAFTKLLKNRRLNSIIVDFTKLPEIYDNPELDYFKPFGRDDNGIHRQELINILGEKEYKKHIEQQTQQLKDYLSDRNSRIELMLENAGVDKFEDLPKEEKHRFTISDAAISPTFGIRDYWYNEETTVEGVVIQNNGRYNHYIPRAKKLNITGTSIASDGRISFTDSTEDTGFYNEDFKQIEENDTLYKFYELASEVTDQIRNSLPPELQRQMSQGTIPAHNKTIAEVILDEDTNQAKRLFPAFNEMMDRFKKSWTIGKEGTISNTIIDPKTGQPNYTVSTDFIKGNIGEIQKQLNVEIAQLESNIFNVDKNKEALDTDSQRNGAITNNTRIDLTKVTDTLRGIIEAYNGGTIPAEQMKSFPIKRSINEYVTHNVVQSQSFDLTKLLKLYSHLSAVYAAKNNALPLMEIAKTHYENLSKPTLNNHLKTKENKYTGETEVTIGRKKGNMQMDDWFNQVPLHNYTNFKSKQVSDKLVYSRREKELIDKIDKTIEKGGISEDRKNQLLEIKSRLGSIFTESSITDRLLSFTRFLGLGYNIPSSIFNNIEGFVANMIQASSNEFYDGRHIFYGMKVTRYSRLKALFGYNSPLANKNSTLMNRYNIILDSRNELQKSTIKTNFSSLSKLSPYYLNASVEYLNQSPIMIASLKTLTLKDINGENETSVWDAMDKDGRLLEQYRTEENIANWEELSGDTYKQFKRKINEAIVKAHGNYDELRTIKAKSTVIGRLALMFKTWMTSQIFSRFAVEQYNVKSQSTQKGRYRSLTKTTGALSGAALGLVSMGPVGAIIGAGLGFTGSAIWGNKTALDAEITIGKQLIDTTKQIALRFIGVPINTISGSNKIDVNKGFEDWGMSEVDARNMRANVTEIAHILSSFLLYLVIKKLFSSDDDKKQSALGVLLTNKTLQLLSNSQTFTSATAFGESTGSMPLYRFLTDVGNLFDAVQKFFNGDDIMQSGVNAGQSNLALKSQKVFLPSILKDPFTLGFGSASKRVYNEPVWGEYFKSADKQASEDIKRERAARKLELTEMGYEDEKQIRKILDTELPTESKLKKKGLTREQYEEQFGASDYELPEIIEVQEEPVEE